MPGIRSLLGVDMPGPRSLLGLDMPGPRSLPSDWWEYTFHVYPQKVHPLEGTPTILPIIWLTFLGFWHSKDDYTFTLIQLFFFFTVSFLE